MSEERPTVLRRLVLWSLGLLLASMAINTALALLAEVWWGVVIVGVVVATIVAVIWWRRRRQW